MAAVDDGAGTGAGTGTQAAGGAGQAPSGPHGLHTVELVGPHLRATGHMALGRFPRLADLVNHNRGFIVLHDARLLDVGGRPLGLDLPELVVNQDEITFIGHAGEEGGAAGGRVQGGGGTRRYVVFAPGHTLTGTIHLFREISLANFVEATDPRFLDVADAAARPRRAPGAVIRYGWLLVNRTHITAIAELPEGATDPAEPGA